jgi:O-antigen ligase
MMSKKAFIVFLLVLLASPLWAPGFVKDRVLETEIDSVEAQITGDVTDRLDPTAAVRLEIWSIVLREVAKRPVFGYGFGSVPMLTVGHLGTAFSAHSLYLETLGDTGLIGLVILVWLLTACVRSGFELTRRATTPLTRGLAVGFVAATAVLVLANVFGQRFLHRSIAGSYFVLAGLVERAILIEKDKAFARREEAMTT